MVAIGSMLFCDHCGSLMPRTTGATTDQMLRCEDCLLYTKDTSDKVIVSTSKPSAFPSALRSKHNDVQNVNTEELRVESIANEECPQCHAKEMFYHTKQLRSADEGSTVFYRCGECATNSTRTTERREQDMGLLYNQLYRGHSGRSSDLGYHSILHLPILLVLGHIESDNDAISHDLFRVIQEVF